MLKIVTAMVPLAATFCLCSLASPQEANAQVTTFVPGAPVVSYVPQRRGLFGRRIVYRPVVSYPAVPVTTIPVAPVTVARVFGRTSALAWT